MKGLRTNVSLISIPKQVDRAIGSWNAAKTLFHNTTKWSLATLLAVANLLGSAVQIDDMQDLEAKAKTLMSQNAALEKQVQQKEAELNGARQAKTAAKSSQLDSEGSSRPKKDPAAKQAELNNLVQRWLATVGAVSWPEYPGCCANRCLNLVVAA